MSEPVGLQQSEPERDSQSRGITRRRFLRESAALPPLLAALFAAPLAISCADSSSDDDDDDDSGGDVDGVEGDISPNHGHTCVITQAELDAGEAVQLLLTTGNGHTHTLDLTIPQVEDIAAGTQVTGNSSFYSTHDHVVTFN